MARFLGDFLAQRGYDVQLQEVEPGRFQTIATLKGSGGGKSLMLNGHIDIDPLAMGWKRDPWTPMIEGDFIYGAGIRNMKSGVSSMIAAAEAIRRSGTPLKGDLVLACVVGELQGGVGTSYLCRHGPLTDMAVVPEPFGANNILTVHAGVLEMAIHVLGNSRHISRQRGRRRRNCQDVQGRSRNRRGGVHLHPAPRPAGSASNKRRRHNWWPGPGLRSKGSEFRVRFLYRNSRRPFPAGYDFRIG